MMLYGRIKRIKGAAGYVAELLIGRFGVGLYTSIERTPHAAPQFVFELRGWVIK